MSHQIEDSAIAYVGTEGTPWHGMGEPILKNTPPKEILRAAKLNWPVLRSTVQFSIPGRNELASDLDHQVIFRGDNKMVLDVTGKKYIPHQNEDVLDFFSEFVAAGDMFIDVAGALNGGKQIWVLAKMEDTFTLAGGDKVGGYVLLVNPHQYGKGMIAKMTAIRAVCWNTISAALSSSGKSVKIWHTKEFTKARQDEAKQKLGIAKERFDAMKSDAKTLAATNIDNDDVVKIFAKLTGGDPTDELEQQSRTVQRLMELFLGAGKGADLKSAKGTTWGALNAVTQWVDHEYGRSAHARLNNAWLGRGDVMKRDAMSMLLQKPVAA